MAIVNATLVNLLVAGNGGHTISVVDGQQTILVDSKAVPLGTITSVSPSATTCTVNELEKFNLLEASRQTTVYNLVNAVVATAIASGVALAGLTNWNTSAVLGNYTIPAGGNQSTVPNNQPFPVFTDNYTWDSNTVANEQRGVEAPTNPITTRP